MRKLLVFTCTWLCLFHSTAQQRSLQAGKPAVTYTILKTESRIPGLQIALLNQQPNKSGKELPVLILHGSYISAAQSSGYKLSGVSWLNNLSSNGYDAYALDYLGYGSSDRYPELRSKKLQGNAIGQAKDIYQDVDKAVDFILKRTGKSRLYLIGHSWGGSVAALYAEKFPGKLEKLILYSALTPTPDSSMAQQFNYTYVKKTPRDLLVVLKSWTPSGKECLLEKDFLQHFEKDWPLSDPLAIGENKDSIMVPSGAQQDIEEMAHNKPYYDPAKITVPTLLIRGEYDDGPGNADYGTLMAKMVNAPYKKYVVLANGTHIIHLEKERFELYREILHFLRQ
ncbi:alpha/beta hydrolase [Pseudoflavitalea sp. G-6-1-2]|uniref:alpha/beta hydrolase n=1 Tax=Pseudoflavitalea sp. G-6-1-2 TaxID=2728841 RepID=UPI00146A28A6|nr:alpha/beta fold hydrolase [Pseudoflavitalea sp. G-6-1-2]NML22538.1 alpha/beta hydrolase [Pseudoflavitalea sp. G-6-1-2]